MLAFPFRLGGTFSPVTFEHRFDGDDEYRQHTYGGNQGKHGFQHDPTIRAARRWTRSQTPEHLARPGRHYR